MDLEFSEEEAELRDNVRAVSWPGSARRRSCGRSTRARARRRPSGQKMVELDWPGLAIAEEHGGLGLGFLELAIVAEELGRAVAPSPFLATVTQFAPAVRELGDDAGPSVPAAASPPGSAHRHRWPSPRAAAGSPTRWPSDGRAGRRRLGARRREGRGASTAPPPTSSSWSPAATAGLGAFVVARRRPSAPSPAR